MLSASSSGVSVPTGAGTPLDIIDFTDALDAVAGCAAGPLGAESIRARRPVTDLRLIREELAAVGEVLVLERVGTSPSVEPVPEAAEPLARLRIAGSMLDGRALVVMRKVLTAARRTAGELKRVALDAPRAAALLVELPPATIDKRLERSLDDDGVLLDTADPELGHARREVGASRARLVKRLEGILRALGPESEGSVTLRNGRYVIPVRRDDRKRPDGIVHDESASGGTLFIEPTAAIELGNAMREAELAEERITQRVLREITEEMRPHHGSLVAAHRMCVAADDLLARARYAARVNGHVPAVASAPAPLRLCGCRHPVLLARGIQVVPFDLTLDGIERTLLVSGPNTGGKTVLLKATGLVSAMAACGIVPPVGDGSTLPIFERIFADIGDHQSLQADLSTFSAHVATLRDILDQASDRSLILLDEVGSGTDPAEGSALAAAVLLELTRRGALTLATTHMGALKDLATTSPGVVNGSLEFDIATLGPTFRFQKGVPGRSYGLAIARRLGLDDGVLREAETLVPDEDRRLDALLAELEKKQLDVAQREAALETLKLDLDNLNARLSLQQHQQESLQADLKERAKTFERDAKKEAREVLLEARKQVEAAIELARQGAEKEARRVLEEEIQRGHLSQVAGLKTDPATRDLRLATFGVGDEVRMSTGQSATVEQVRKDGRVVVRAGSAKLTVDAGSLEKLSGGEKRKEKRKQNAYASARELTAPSAPSEVDLRGMTGDEAQTVVEQALDAAVMGETPILRIIHGMGTGVVRERVQRVLKADRRVKAFAFAPQAQGGTGVTIAEFEL
ncbi:MAG: Smr/MutS family protein [Gemmatimonadetes bacterium]|nr:Smr/MutS family protein [Gemmatimonadota bacterium]